MGKNDKKLTCFVVSPIGSEGSDTRKRSDQVLKYVLSPPVIEAGYEIIRADTIDDPGMITTQVIDMVVNADLVIADLTENNPNVFYELAIRHAVAKPFIQVAEKGPSIPFDISDLRTIFFDIHDLDSVDNAKIQISQQMTAINSDEFRVITPLTFAVDMKSFETSGDKEEFYLAKILDQISDLRKQVDRIDTNKNHIKEGGSLIIKNKPIITHEDETKKIWILYNNLLELEKNKKKRGDSDD